jgi:hypothetical protein
LKSRGEDEGVSGASIKGVSLLIRSLRISLAESESRRAAAEQRAADLEERSSKRDAVEKRSDNGAVTPSAVTAPSIPVVATVHKNAPLTVPTSPSPVGSLAATLAERKAYLARLRQRRAAAHKQVQDMQQRLRSIGPSDPAGVGRLSRAQTPPIVSPPSTSSAMRPLEGSPRTRLDVEIKAARTQLSVARSRVVVLENKLQLLLARKKMGADT